jgi:hypothetical protein
MGTAYEAHSKNGDKTEQQALQHAAFSRLGTTNAAQYTQRHEVPTVMSF